MRLVPSPSEWKYGGKYVWYHFKEMPPHEDCRKSFPQLCRFQLYLFLKPLSNPKELFQSSTSDQQNTYFKLLASGGICQVIQIGPQCLETPSYNGLSHLLHLTGNRWTPHLISEIHEFVEWFVAAHPSTDELQVNVSGYWKTYLIFD